ncbi:YitT family protein [Longirhabdus pacifica]|uniref:YitT family protein n=1 Tax=Longirhabdus pacifica TaxID=2305227 RepID=UPI001008FC14|nr:YitT family protein [Longirhabdus pacifica]
MIAKTLARKKALIPYNSRGYILFEYILLILGSLLIALSFNWFLAPNGIASGGVTGLSIVLEGITGIRPAITQWVLNIILFLGGLSVLGGQFGLKTLVGSIVLPFFILMTSGLEPITNEDLLAAIYGGIGIGLGLGIVFRGRGSTGGLDLAAQIIHRYTGLSLGMAIAMMDGMVILSAGLVFSWEQALYALVGLFVTSKTIDIVQAGLAFSKVAFIISEQTDAIKDNVLRDLDRGLTRLVGYGGYTGKSRDVLMVVVSPTEVSKLKAIVKMVDQNAFIILSNTTEVLGEGFKKD